MARGSGIPELKGYLNGNRQQGLFHWRTFAWRSVGICLVITATMPFGREGPSVHIGACVASMALNLPWRARLGWQPSPEERRQILQLGSAAGVAAAFNAPIGGLLYVMEEVASNLPGLRLASDDHERHGRGRGADSLLSQRGTRRLRLFSHLRSKLVHGVGPERSAVRV